VFAGEPVLRVEAPIEQAQLVETYLFGGDLVSTMVASKAARVRLAAGDRRVVDFGSRRAHGPQAACWAARASYLAGLDGTSNVWASCRLGVPPSGTMAHSFVLAFPGEHEAFRAYNRTFPDRTVLLVDTFDTLEAVERAAADVELQFVGIRLDSGNIVELARACRRILDRHGRQDVRIVASGDLDEGRIRSILSAGAPVDSFGVGTRMVTSEDAPRSRRSTSWSRCRRMQRRRAAWRRDRRGSAPPGDQTGLAPSRPRRHPGGRSRDARDGGPAPGPVGAFA